MSSNLTAVCVRLDPKTLHRIKVLAQDSAAEIDERQRLIRQRPYNRSELIRHVIHTGLDLLQGEPPLELQGTEPCPTGTQNRQAASDDPASA